MSISTSGQAGRTANEPAPSDAARGGSSPHVLHVISDLFYGGGQRVVLDLMTALPAAGVSNASLCTLGERADSPLAAHRAASVPYNGHYNNPIVLWRAARRLRKLVAAMRPDIVHTHGVDADLIGALAIGRRRTRQVCHLHITPPTDRNESWRARARRKLFRRLTARDRAWFIAVSDAVREQMADYYRLPIERIVTVRNGVDLSQFPVPTASAAHDCIVIGVMARLAPMKGLEYLIQAATHLRQRSVKFEIRIAGSGELRASLEQLAASLGVDDLVHFLGQVSDPKSFYRDVDVFVLPSISTEGLPLVVLEAMAMGRPIVATRLAGTPEVVRDGEEGWLVPPGDAVALAAAIERLAASPELRARMGAAGQARVSMQFRIDRVAREVVDVYQRMLDE